MLSITTIRITYHLNSFTDFDVKLSDKEIRYIASKMEEGFTGGNIETLRKNLHSFLRPKILAAKYFKKITNGVSVKYEICKKGDTDATPLTIGKDITCDDLLPLRITKQNILDQIEKITINDANVKMEEEIEEFVLNL